MAKERGTEHGRVICQVMQLANDDKHNRKGKEIGERGLEQIAQVRGGGYAVDERLSAAVAPHIAL